MSKHPVNLPVARHWRDIPQEVKPRALSREGRRRAAARGVRLAGLTVALTIACAAGWEVARAWTKGPADVPAQKGARIGDHVEAESDGVLNGDKAWLMGVLALPADATLDGIDLSALRARIVATGQVQAADVIRHFPRTLTVRMAERTPVARVRVAPAGKPQATLLVARDGVVYSGHGYDAALLDALPWLAGVAPQGGRLGPIAGMDSVNELLLAAKSLAPRLYRDWWVLDLSRLGSDGLIQIRTREGQTFVFGTETDDFTHQLGHLAYILDQFPGRPPARIDLSLGTSVPVSGVVSDGAAAPRPAAPTPSQAPFNFDSLFHSS